MASGLYAVNFRDLAIATPIVMNLLLNTNKVILVTDTYTPGFDTHNDYADITNEVAAGGGYTQNSKTVGGTPTWAITGTGATTALKYSWSAAVEWTSSTITARGMVITTAVATGLLIVAVTFGQDYASTNGTFSISAHANGIFTVDLVP
jgi:hypothetical protein